MKLSWVFVIGLLVFVAVFSVQNAGPVTVRFLAWETSVSAALVIQLAALLGGLVGLTAGAWSRRSRKPAADTSDPRPPDREGFPP
ncbi:MAG TPA: LapA family protein [Lacunisphaera sp.]|nr:LapA family protein [Lacunisphaera sp.]